MRQRLIAAGNGCAVFVALLILWQLVIWIFRVQPFMLPTPLAVAKACVHRFPSVMSASEITAGESAAGCLLASLLALWWRFCLPSRAGSGGCFILIQSYFRRCRF